MLDRHLSLLRDQPLLHFYHHIFRPCNKPNEAPLQAGISSAELTGDADGVIIDEDVAVSFHRYVLAVANVT